MVKINITEEHFKHATDLFLCGNPTFNRDFSSKEEFKIIGNLGEVVVRQLFGLSPKGCSRASDGGYDLVINGTKIDVKVQQSYGTFEELTYGMNIQASTMEFKGADCILFTHYSKKYRVLTIAGAIKKSEIPSVAELHEKGSINPTNGKPFYASLYEVPLSALKEFSVDHIKNCAEVRSCELCESQGSDVCNTNY